MQKLLGCTGEEWAMVEGEIYGFGIADKSPEGIMMCRRMMREAQEESEASEHGRRAAGARWSKCSPDAHSCLQSQSQNKSQSKSQIPKGGSGEPQPPAPKAKGRKFSDEDRAAVRAWVKLFADCYREVNKAWPTGYEPDSTRWPHPKVVAAALWFSTRTVTERVRVKLLAVLRGEFYASPPANLAEFRVMYDRLTDACRKPRGADADVAAPPPSPEQQAAWSAERKRRERQGECAAAHRVGTDKGECGGTPDLCRDCPQREQPGARRYTPGPDRRTGLTPGGGFKRAGDVARQEAARLKGDA
jgi:hypothetical protein